jgi:translation elongation factor EF-Tu-like GTPase
VEVLSARICDEGRHEFQRHHCTRQSDSGGSHAAERHLISTYLVVRLDDVVMVEEDPDEVEVVVGADEVELLMEELESVELELL